MKFTDYFGDTPRGRLLDFLADHPASDYSITEMAEKSGVSRPTIYQELGDLERTKMLVQTRTLGRSRLFKLNTGHPVVRDILVQDIADIRMDFQETAETQA